MEWLALSAQQKRAVHSDYPGTADAGHCGTRPNSGGNDGKCQAEPSVFGVETAIAGEGLMDFLNILFPPKCVLCRKVLEALLPLARGHEEIAFLLHCFTSDVQQRIALLLRINTLPAAYTLFREMKTQEEDLALLRSTCLALMKRGDARAFRLASLCVSYFGLEDIPGTFSLTLQPYELSRLDQSYDTFKACFD